jgi:hypothetical protein
VQIDFLRIFVLSNCTTTQVIGSVQPDGFLMMNYRKDRTAVLQNCEYNLKNTQKPGPKFL